MTLTNEQWNNIQEAIGEVEEPLDKQTVTLVTDAIRQLVDKEPYRQDIIALLGRAEDLNLEVIPDDESGEITIWTGTRFTDDSLNYSQIVFMSDDDDDEEDEPVE